MVQVFDYYDSIQFKLLIMKPQAKKNLVKWLTYILTAILGALGGNQIPL